MKMAPTNKKNHLMLDLLFEFNKDDKQNIIAKAVDSIEYVMVELERKRFIYFILRWTSMHHKELCIANGAGNSIHLIV